MSFAILANGASFLCSGCGKPGPLAEKSWVSPILAVGRRGSGNESLGKYPDEGEYGHEKEGAEYCPKILEKWGGTGLIFIIFYCKK